MRTIDYSTKFLDSVSVQELGTVDWRLSCIMTGAIIRFLGDREKEAPNLLHRIRVTDGRRTVEEQRAMVKRGASRTMTSFHLKGMAVDLAYIRAGVARWETTWYEMINKHVVTSVRAFGLDDGDVEWGGMWKGFRDAVHWQLMLPPFPDHCTS